MQKITTHLWFDKEAKEAAEFYTSLFPHSKIIDSNVLEGTPSGSVDVMTIEIVGQEFTLISAGPLFAFNPSISFHVALKTKEDVDVLWNELVKGGKVLMELGSYPFSERYGWLSDKFGLSWQITFVGDRTSAPAVKPILMFVGDVCGKAEDAVKFYTSTFTNSTTFQMLKYAKSEEPNREGTVKYTGFTLAGKEFGAMDSAQPHQFAFNEAISFMVHCKDQKEIDYYWKTLSAVPESEQCGWLKDKFGVSWQVVPNDMDRLMREGSKEQIARVTQAFLKMKKFDLAELKKAYNG